MICRGKTPARQVAATALSWAVAIVAILAPSIVNAAEIDEPSNWTGVKVGALFEGTTEIDSIEVDQKTSFMLGLFYDFPMGRDFQYGLAMDILRMDWKSGSDEYDLDESELMLDLSINVKAFMRVPGNRVAIRPGVGVGYGVMRRREAFNGTNYLTLKAYAEIAVAINDTKVLLLDAGVWNAPTGGDSETDISVGPLVFVRGGLAF